MIKGFITGSFRPFHIGHESLINYAKSNCDELTILITTLSDEIIPYKYRLKWVLSTYLDDPKVTIVADTIKEPDLNGDALSIWWGFYIKSKFGQFDRVFTSEDYGEIFAKSMNAEHWEFNKNRNLIPISATEIRNKPITNWNYLNNFAKDYFVKKIAIVGTESTGKSTLTKQLAEYFSKKYGEIFSYFVGEAGDDIVIKTIDTKIEQIKEIAEEHAKRIIRQSRKTNRVLFIDTDLLITKSYANFLFKQEIKFEPWIEKANEIDLYIYLNPDAPYIDNGRRLDKETRDKLHLSHSKFYHNKNVKNFSFNNSYKKRFEDIVQYIEKYLSQF